MKRDTCLVMNLYKYCVLLRVLYDGGPMTYKWMFRVRVILFLPQFRDAVNRIHETNYATEEVRKSEL